MKFNISTIIVLIILLAGLGNCKGKPDSFPGGVLVNLQGTVKVKKKAAEAIELTKENLLGKISLVREGDTITTSRKSSIDLQFQTGISMRIGPESNLVISKSILDNKNINSNINIALDQGKLMVKTGKLGKDSEVIIQSPTLVASVRGTEFLVNANDDKNILVDQGSVELTKPNDQTDKENTKIISEGNKGESSEDDIVVNPLTNEDKKELNQMKEGLEFISEETRNRMNEIVSEFEGQKERIHKEFDQQVDKNKQTMSEEKQRQQSEFQKEKNRITGEGSAKSELERIKQGN